MVEMGEKGDSQKLHLIPSDALLLLLLLGSLSRPPPPPSRDNVSGEGREMRGMGSFGGGKRGRAEWVFGT